MCRINLPTALCKQQASRPASQRRHLPAMTSPASDDVTDPGYLDEPVATTHTTSD
ncbi:hypothetical protein JYU34_005203 [Plutella xylostella]|uniref:Uncharacterized protein n=1 Tax=Plutella xylostella TaxID=51655 RepID=A0ABQ7QW32_PLUXY|nr:hypothetical protein JYU34_005203 [Plutella xylostella]